MVSNFSCVSDSKPAPPKLAKLDMSEAASVSSVSGGENDNSLHIAVLFDTNKVGELLAGVNLDINIKDSHGFTALSWACVKGNPATVRMLIEAGADINIQSNRGATAIWLASIYGHTELVKMLIEAGASLLEDALMGASARGHKETAAMLVEAGANIDVVDNQGNTPLIYAGQTGLWRAAYMMMKLSREHSDKEYKRFLFRAERL